MPGYPDGPALLTAARAGQGTIVIVEGESPQEDQYFYTRWFGDLALQVSFFAQNGWEKVVTAVADLRLQLPARKVFGIIDRDFTSAVELAIQDVVLPPSGILRTRKFTVENYLLNPEGWASVLRKLTRGVPPLGWTTNLEIEQRILEAYQDCLPLAARNAVIHDEHLREPTGGLRYHEHPRAALQNPPDAELLAWQSTRPTAPPMRLDEVYRQRLAALQASGLADREELVTGKAVLKVLLEKLGQATRLKVRHDLFISLYIDSFPAPPPDLKAIVDRLL